MTGTQDAPTGEARTPDGLDAAFMAIYGDPELSSDPQRVYRRNRAAGATSRIGPIVLANSRAVVHDALHRPGEFSSAMASARLGNTRPLIPMQLDPPDHMRYRRVLNPLFSPARMAELEPDLVALAGSLVDELADRGSCDFAAEFAVRLPTMAFLRLLGLPDEDAGELLRLKNAIVHPPWGDPAETERAQRTAGERLYRYFESAVAADSKYPRALIGDLGRTEVDGRPLTPDEIVDICYLILLAGLDTVTDTLTLSIAFLARNPDHRARIVADPAVIPAAVEELLRWESPIPGVPRLVTTDTEIGGCPVRAGEVVYVSFGSANTDEQELPDAYQVRFDRRQNRHYAFGGGIHHCLGVHLARLELAVALREWHRRIPRYAIQDETELRYTPGLRSIEHLPLTYPTKE